MTPLKKQPVPFGKYLLLDRINVGGMAEVWRGKTAGLGGIERLVAVKRILPNIAEDEEFVTMFMDEARITVQLAHANIGQIYDFNFERVHNSYYIAMEYIPGKDLRALFDRCRKQGNPAPVPLVCYVLGKVCDGLDYAHRKRDNAGRELNIVHRDVSPQNVLLSFDGDVKVIDFGVAKAAGKATRTQAGILKGKFGYMSPEQVRAEEIDRRSDIFAIGTCLYELLTGERLFTGESDFSVLDKVRAAEIPSPGARNPDVPEPLERIVYQALARDVEARYQYASEVSEDLQRFLVSSGSLFTRKDLAAFMRSTFAEDVEKEAARMAEYADVHVPPPGPTPPPARRSNPGALPAIPGAIAAPALTAPPRRTNPGLVAAGAPPQLPTEATVAFGPREESAPPASEPPSFEDQTVLNPPLTIPPVTQPLGAREEPAPWRRATPEEVRGTDLQPALANEAQPDTDRGTPVDPEVARATLAYTRPRPKRGGAALAPLLARLEGPRSLLLAALGLACFTLSLGVLIGSHAGGRELLCLDMPPALQGKAHVRINGKDLHVPTRWPLLVAVPPGMVQVHVTAEGFRTFDQSVEVPGPDGEPPVVRAELAPDHAVARLVVATNPPDAEVRLGGVTVRPRGKREFFLGEVPVGKEVPLEVVEPGYRPYRHVVRATSAEDAQVIKAELERERTSSRSSR